MADSRIGQAFRPRDRQLDSPALVQKMLLRNIERRDIDAILAENEVIEVYEHDDRTRYVLLGHVGERPLHPVVGQDESRMQRS